MTVYEFFNRVEKLITQINDDATLGTNKIGITADQRLDILNANTIEEAITFLLAYNIPQYVVDFAISGQDLAGITSDDAAVAAAREQTGLFGNTDAYIGATDFYTQNDLVNLFAGIGDEQIAGIQADLINARLLSVGDGFLPGEWDTPTQRAFERVLERANLGGVTEIEKQNGSAWRNVLKEFVANPVPIMPDTEVFLPQDPAENAQTVKNLYARELNRDPSAYEIKLLSNELYKQAEAAYKQSEELGQVAQAQPAFTGDDLLQGQYGNYAAENVQQAIDEQGLTQINPASRMKEKFDRITENEKARLGENYSARNTRTSILRSIAGRPN